jgi:hypothetical protein
VRVLDPQDPPPGYWPTRRGYRHATSGRAPHRDARARPETLANRLAREGLHLLVDRADGFITVGEAAHLDQDGRAEVGCGKAARWAQRFFRVFAEQLSVTAPMRNGMSC